MLCDGERSVDGSHRPWSLSSRCSVAAVEAIDSGMALAPQPVESVVWANVDQMARYSLGMDLLVEQHALEPYPVWSKKNPPAAG